MKDGACCFTERVLVPVARDNCEAEALKKCKKLLELPHRRWAQLIFESAQPLPAVLLCFAPLHGPAVLLPWTLPLPLPSSITFTIVAMPRMTAAGATRMGVGASWTPMLVLLKVSWRPPCPGCCVTDHLPGN
ncbi:uncharacterized protein isoform X2 [Macaca fascicularis]|uniref:uncharacterized protein isoform X2 n=1 Tax=Macaca fascicularis TaxID=9541 RepID=UPI003D15CA8D